MCSTPFKEVTGCTVCEMNFFPSIGIITCEMIDTYS